jgi:hypothetical protein
MAEVPPIVTHLTESALGPVAQTALGAIALLSLAVAILAVWKLSSVQDKRAADAKEASERIEKMIAKISELQTDTNRTIDSLVQAESTAAQVSREQTLLLSAVKQSVDTTIRDAVLMRGRSLSPTPPSPEPPRRIR